MVKLPSPAHKLQIAAIEIGEFRQKYAVAKVRVQA